MLAAFGLTGSAVRLRGGQGTSWRVGDVVLKPGVDAEIQEWLGTELATVEQRGFRLPAVHRAVDGSWVVEGWAAHEALDGLDDVRAPDWRQLIDSARALHAVTARLRRPGFIDRRSDPWAVADRAAWGEIPRRVPLRRSPAVCCSAPSSCPLPRRTAWRSQPSAFGRHSTASAWEALVARTERRRASFSWAAGLSSRAGRARSAGAVRAVDTCCGS